MDIEKITENILKKIKKKWSGETQIGFSELAMQDAIRLALSQSSKRAERGYKK